MPKQSKFENVDLFASLNAVMSSWYAFPVAFTRRAIWLTLTPIFCISAVIAFISAWSI